eukprot:CAMPEP_0113527816 /NCGR_PEP_ID=MMETSP0015_2-20120614/1502_1 /TAXON_ID=2838 /ORGANISM="Odontella" /LENGTH=663 /DNA_ID=CAMNT_0000426285 /DNA_START=58 /DNA_END=2049 /DNA_ORIENTATION=+ /assembly_acc=CAM_ASM_000160
MAEGNDKPAAAAASNEVEDSSPQPRPQQQQEQQPHPPPQDVVTYLTSLIDSAAIASGAHSSALNALASLSDSAGHFIPSSSGAGSSTPGECILFLRAVSAHSDALSSLTEHFCAQLLETGGVQAPGGRGAAGGAGDEEDAGSFLKHLSSVIQAVGFAAVLVTRRSDIGRSGIIPTLAKFALAPSSSPSSPPPPYFALTPAHPELLQCCLLAGQYRFATRFVDRHPVGSVALLPLPKPVVAATSTTEEHTPHQNSNVGGRIVFPSVTAETYLRYHYYLGLVKIGCNDLVSGVKAFESCLTTPARGAISAVQVAARKKMVLCRCLMDGGVSSMDVDAKTEASDLNVSEGFVADPFIAGGGSGQNPKRSLRVRTILSVPSAASSAVSRYLSAASSSTSSSSLPKSSAAGGRQSMGPTAGGGEPESEVQESLASSSRRGGNRQGSRLDHERNYYCLKSYDDLVIAFFSADGGKKFRDTKDAISELLEADGNAGLAVQMEAALKTAAVRQTSKVYEAAPLAKVANEIKMQSGTESQEEAERLILSMMPAPRPGTTLEDSRVDPLEARIDQGNNTVRFGPFGGSDESGNDDSWLADDEVDLSARMGACAALAKRVTALDLNVSTSNRFQQISIRGESQSAATASSGSGSKGGGGSGGEAGPKSVAELAG